jgi:hypothetical protein
VLEHGRYRRVEPAADGSVTSAVLGLELRIHDGWLRLWDRARGAWIPSPEEERTARDDAEARAAHEAAARHDAEARAAALEAEVARLRELLEQKGG